MTHQTYLPLEQFTVAHMVEQAIAAIQTFEPTDRPYHGCFSGGKDSVVIKALADLAGVRVKWHYNQTTIDAPELVHFIKREHADVNWIRPRHGNFFRRAEQKGLPTRRARWCCEEYKEQSAPDGARLILGVRAAESKRRARSWSICSYHKRSGDYAIAPILYWTDRHVWEFIRAHQIPYCSLYDEGWKRLGCVGCPIANATIRQREFRRWPGYERLWMRTCQRIWDRRAGTMQRDGREWFGSAKFDTWQEMWSWWLYDKSLPQTECLGLLELMTGG